MIIKIFKNPYYEGKYTYQWFAQNEDKKNTGMGNSIGEAIGNLICMVEKPLKLEDGTYTLEVSVK